MQHAGRANFIAVCFDSGLDEESRVLATTYAESHRLTHVTHLYAQQPDSVCLQYIPHKVFLDAHQRVVYNYDQSVSSTDDDAPDLDWTALLAIALSSKQLHEAIGS